MIDQLDILLRKLITSTVAGFASDDQVRFQPPDDDWRTYVKTLSIAGQPANALNFYLVDLRENRKLRSNDSRRRCYWIVTISSRRQILAQHLIQ